MARWLIASMGLGAPFGPLFGVHFVAHMVSTSLRGSSTRQAKDLL